MSSSHPSVPWRAHRLADVLLIALLIAAGFLLGCYEMGDSDIWWHLSGGRWILANGRVPDLDPFAYERSWNRSETC